MPSSWAMLSRDWTDSERLYITFVGLPSCDLSLSDPVTSYSGVSFRLDRASLPFSPFFGSDGAEFGDK